MQACTMPEVVNDKWMLIKLQNSTTLNNLVFMSISMFTDSGYFGRQIPAVDCKPRGTAVFTHWPHSTQRCWFLRESGCPHHWRMSHNWNVVSNVWLNWVRTLLPHIFTTTLVLNGVCYWLNNILMPLMWGVDGGIKLSTKKHSVRLFHTVSSSALLNV